MHGTFIHINNTYLKVFKNINFVLSTHKHLRFKSYPIDFFTGKSHSSKFNTFVLFIFYFFHWGRCRLSLIL